MNIRKYRIPLLFLILASGAALPDKPCFAKVAEPESKTVEKTDSMKTGYEVDGRTSASVLAAQRAHSVDRHDEMGLAVYSGVFAIGLIVFFTQLGQRK